MSNFYPHLISGVIVGTISTVITYNIIETPTYFNLLTIVGGIVGALIPDMDIKSKSSQCLYILFAGLALYCWYIGRIDISIMILIFSIIPQFFKHRGFIHSIIFGIASSVFLYYILNQMIYLNVEITIPIVITYIFGFITHLILDNI